MLYWKDNAIKYRCCTFQVIVIALVRFSHMSDLCPWLSAKLSHYALYAPQTAFQRDVKMYTKFLYDVIYLSKIHLGRLRHAFVSIIVASNWSRPKWIAMCVENRVFSNVVWVIACVHISPLPSPLKVSWGPVGLCDKHNVFSTTPPVVVQPTQVISLFIFWKWVLL